MREALTSDTLLNTLAMIRAEGMTPILVVEGDDDIFLIKPHLSDAVLLIKGIGGKSGVLRAARDASDRHLTDLMFLVDADYDKVLNPSIRYPGLVEASVHHDIIIDTIVMNRQLLERVLDAQVRSYTRSSGTSLNGSELLTEGFRLAAKIALLRLINDQDDLSLNLRHFPFGQLSSTDPNSREIIQLTLARSNSHLSLDALTAKLEQQSTATYSDHEIVGDHDLFRALARVLTLRGVRGIGADDIFTALLGAIGCNHIMETQWHTAIDSWASARGKTGLTCPCAA